MKKLLVLLCVVMVGAVGLTVLPQEASPLTINFKTGSDASSSTSPKTFDGILQATAFSSFGTGVFWQNSTYGLGVGPGGNYSITNYSGNAPTFTVSGYEWVVFQRPTGYFFDTVSISQVTCSSGYVQPLGRVRVASGTTPDMFVVATAQDFTGNTGDFIINLTSSPLRDDDYLFVEAPKWKDPVTATEYAEATGFRIAQITLSDPTSVPEPTTLLLLGTGLICLAGFGRKKFFKK
jgi:hypothetical protein